MLAKARCHRILSIYGWKAQYLVKEYWLSITCWIG
jgi:hypothetical protein